MVPQPLAPLDPHKTRALTSIYAPKKLRVRKQRPQTMLEEIPLKSSLSPFHPLPAIGQKMTKDKTKVIVVDFNKKDFFRPGTVEKRSTIKLQEVLKPLTPLRIPGYGRTSAKVKKKNPQPLLRENTYDVLEPIYVNSGKIKHIELDQDLNQALTPKNIDSEKEAIPKISPKTRFKRAALQVAKLTSMPETGKLLCLREKQTFNFYPNEDHDTCRLQELPKSPPQKLNELSEIFQNLEMKGRHKDKMKKENSWF